ncbi:nicotinate phosphoribosyltransferase [Anaeramoeba flamelloides]|uniref:Nicotinate phosphoribosyltransferase n=1 Tax=Anaeramoeba flamelloides TaxID=1746091 RepID=A0AAV7Z198_9EUKA|nr:nicotinate phosphoribosyltransferase [Anaeramoeba flamelloides]
MTSLLKNTNPLVSPLLTDKYQFTMAYAYWKGKRHQDHATFDLFYRKNPFKGSFAQFAGLNEILRFMSSFKITNDDLDFLKKDMSQCDPGYFKWLKNLDCSEVTIHAPQEGNIVFPKEPLVRVEGPLGILQLLETPFLNLTNYATLMTTNARRMRIAAGQDKTLLEFGCRRAQGPDGALSASRYSYIGGFDASSHVLAGKMFGIPIKGTHAHSWISSLQDTSEINVRNLTYFKNGKKKEIDFVDFVLENQKKLGWTTTNKGELAAFIDYALAFPAGFLGLVDTYDTLFSGIPNYLIVAYSLYQLGYLPIGIRLDSGKLSALSRATRKMFKDFAKQISVPHFAKLKIVASNDINEGVLYDLKKEGSEIDIFGIGTHLVTCQAQPALGAVFKLVEINNEPRIKLSNSFGKITVPGRKNSYRLFGKDGKAITDVLTIYDEQPPQANKQYTCCDFFDRHKKISVIPSKVEPLLQKVWDHKLIHKLPHVKEIKEFGDQQAKKFDPKLFQRTNPINYPVTLSSQLYEKMHQLWDEALAPQIID